MICLLNLQETSLICFFGVGLAYYDSNKQLEMCYFVNKKYKTMKIAVAGTGYVGMSMATLLAQHNEVVAVDVIPDKVEKINNRISPIQDDYIEKYLA